MTAITGTGHTLISVTGPLDETQIKELKSKGMSDDQISKMALLFKDYGAQGTGGSGGLPPPGDGKVDAPRLFAALDDASANMNADIFAFMAIFQKMSQEMRQTARMDRELSMQAQVSTLQAAAEKIREAAKERYTAAMIQGAAQIAGGVASVAGGMKALGTIGAAKASGGDMNVATSKAQSQSGIGSGIGGIMQGMGGMIAAGYEKKAGEADADRAKLEAGAKMHEAARDKANDMMQQMQDIIRDIRDKLGAMQQSNIETNRGIARNI